MSGRLGAATSGGRHDRHQHHKGSSTHSTRDHGKKHRDNARKGKDKAGSKRRDRRGSGRDVGGSGHEGGSEGVKGIVGHSMDISGSGDISGCKDKIGASEITLHENISPSAVNFSIGDDDGDDFDGGGSIKGGFELFMPSSCSTSINNSTSTSNKQDHHWGSTNEWKTATPDDLIPKVQLWQKDREWTPSPLVCTIPKTSPPCDAASPCSEEDKER